MKKLISLLLALVLCFGVLAGVSIAAAKPTECIPEQAVVVVTHEGDPTAKYYFDALTASLFTWACAGLEGDTTLTLTKDVTQPAGTATNVFAIPFQTKDWYGGIGAKSIIFDLDGHTLSYEGSQNLFRLTRFGITVKNGTIDYTGARSIFSLGSSKANTANSAGTTLYAPVVNLENVHIYNNGTGSGSNVLSNYIFGTTVNVKNSVIYAAKQAAIMMSKTDQSETGNYKKCEKPAKLTVNVENSTIISGQGNPISFSSKVDIAEDTVAAKLKDSTLVSTTGAAYSADFASKFNLNGQSITEKADFSQFLKNGATATGTAYVVGAGSSEGKLPFTDVAESAWYYTFVRDLYNAKVINGMTETTFAPEGTLTYGQALKLITLAVGDAEQAPIDSHWASGYLNNAMGKGWLYNEVNLESKITRLEFCQLAAAAAGIVDQPASNPFSDTADASVLALYNAGIINGMTETTFSPNSSLTRAQISKIIHGIIAK